MDYTFALRFFAILLTILCITLATFLVRGDPQPVKRKIQIEPFPPAQWPEVYTRVSIGCLLMSLVLLLMACVFLLR
ncbi:hypothetical protein BTH42_33065 [Burkholderia sp. SRS-W-2-2016]|uniref:hypothetical protein n=1 Tax=Burkholderia sp. SRS-W-2-2016 TaxID=1926878 RepID=UPI00094AFDBF|nr:hypothetical protein [Burkholderia sp. SRS-W-2-2016]OLL27433.1 hypothetical protein BTH42_33065 [Burkholderia sp. SRS-W-2-2016]